jgi:TonB family protein
MVVLSSATVGNPASTVLPAKSLQQSKQALKGHVYLAVDKEPAFPGGVNKFYEFLGHTIKYPSKMKEKNVQGKVFISFVVETDGSLTNFKILKDIGYGAGKEAVRALALSPKWIPGVQKGQKVRVQYNVPINYALQKEG